MSISSRRRVKRSSCRSSKRCSYTCAGCGEGRLAAQEGRPFIAFLFSVEASLGQLEKGAHLSFVEQLPSPAVQEDLFLRRPASLLLTKPADMCVPGKSAWSQKLLPGSAAPIEA